MKKIHLSHSILFATTIMLMACGEPKADKLILGNIITMDEQNPKAEALVIKDGIIQFAGSEDDARQLCDENTVVEKYDNAAIYPGFMDGHTHGVLAASRFQQADLTELGMDENAKMSQFVDAMKDYMDKNPGKKIYKGSGWVVKDKAPEASMLDSICPDVPMILNSADGHSWWINTAAMKAYGIDKEAVKKYGVDCVRVDKNGNPTGYLSETAAMSIFQAVAISKEECKNGLLMWQDYAFSQGITATTEAALNLGIQNAAEAYQELQDEGKWKLRTYGVEMIDEYVPDDKLDSALNSVMEMNKKYNSEYFKVTGVKIFMDGVVEAHTAWMDDEYDDQPGYFGLKRCTSPDRIAKIVSFCNKNGMNVHFHAIGDAASRVAVEGIAKSVKETGIKDGRNAIAHLQVVHEDVIPKFCENGIIAVVAPLWIPIYPTEYGYTCQYIGKRADTQYPLKSFYDAGVKVNFHSDYPVSNSMSIPFTIYAAVTRSFVNLGEESTHNFKEHITREQALQALTIDVAWQWKQEEHMGSLTKGKIANMVIYDTDFLNDDIKKVFDAKLLATIVDGETVFKSKE